MNPRVVVALGQVGIPQAGGVGLQKGLLLNQVRSSLTEVKSLSLALTPLSPGRPQAAPTPNGSMGGEPVWRAAETEKDSGPGLTDAFERFQMTRGLQAAIERSNHFQRPGRWLAFNLTHQGLVGPNFSLPGGKVTLS